MFPELSSSTSACRMRSQPANLLQYQFESVCMGMYPLRDKHFEIEHRFKFQKLNNVDVNKVIVRQ